MRTNKVANQIIYLKEHLDKGETIFMGGMKDPKEYLERLGEGYSAEESFRTRNIDITLDDILGHTVFTGGEKIKTGYIFRKDDKQNISDWFKRFF